MKFKIVHPESDSEWVEEFDNEDAAYEAYGDGLCSIQKIEEDKNE